MNASPASGRFFVGIDLGTTTTVVAWAAKEGDLSASPEILPIPQRVSAGAIEARPRLPSVLYIPTEDEKKNDPLGEGDYALGEHARRRAAEVPGRAVVSPKSWLSYARIDRTAAILPWGTNSEDGDLTLPKISPIDASARLLSRVRAVWDEAHPGDPLDAQTIILTLPASFDEAARELTLLAASRAGLTVRLLEEPQAALYDYLQRRDLANAAPLPEGLILVVDIGGGTTDLSLIRRVETKSGDDELERVAVGRHLLLGGDNMDLALAAACEAKWDGPGTLDATTFAQLALACRAAKEDLYAALACGNEDATVTVAVAGRGSALIGRAKTAEITRKELDALVTLPFFPDAKIGDPPVRARAALVAMGLPYERDVAITRHVASFLATHATEPVAAVLLNGGVFHAKSLADRLLAVVASWGSVPEVLPNPTPDLAVALGAVAYARALAGRGPLIGSGAAVGYYVAAASTSDAQLSSAPVVISVVPRGAREGVRHVAEGRSFALTLGRPVRFDLYSSNDARIDPPGATVPLDRTRLHRLPPLTLMLPDQARRGETTVVLEGELSAIGTLDLACVETVATTTGAEPRRFRLTFDLRAEVPGETMPPPAVALTRSIAPPAAMSSAIKHLDEARARIERSFRGTAEATARDVKDLLRDLEKLLGDRSEWSTPLARALTDVLLPLGRERRKSEAHERVFWLLTGFCLRPGFGDPLDISRVERLSPMFAERLAFGAPEDGPRGWQAYFVAARRVAAGLLEPTQEKLRDTFDPFVAPKERALKKPKKFDPQSPIEMRALLASLERAPAQRRAELGEWLVERTWTDHDPQLWADIARIGARVPTYASVHHVIAPQVVERWLEHLLRDKWENVPTAARTALELARRTGDRARDVAPAMRASIVTRMKKLNADPAWTLAIEEVVATSDADKAAFYGEALPPGLRLIL